MSETTPHENPCCPVCGAMLVGFSVCQPGSATRYCSDACAEQDAEQHRQFADDSFTRADKFRKAEAKVERLRKVLRTARDFAFQGVHEPDSRHYCKAILELLEKALEEAGR